MCIGVSTAGDATLQAHGKALTFGRVAKQRTRALGCLLGVAKINNRLSFWSKDIAMLVSILRQHAATNCSNFKAPHGRRDWRGEQGKGSLWPRPSRREQFPEVLSPMRTRSQYAPASRTGDPWRINSLINAAQ